MEFPYDQALTRESRENLLSEFYYLFEELDIIFQTKIFLLEQVDLNPTHKNFIRVQGKIEKQIGFFMKLKEVSKHLILLFWIFHQQINNEFEFLYQANFNALKYLSVANKTVKDLRVKKFEQYKPLSKSHSKVKRATISKSKNGST